MGDRRKHFESLRRPVLCGPKCNPFTRSNAEGFRTCKNVAGGNQGRFPPFGQDELAAAQPLAELPRLASATKLPLHLSRASRRLSAFMSRRNKRTTVALNLFRNAKGDLVENVCPLA